MTSVNSRRSPICRTVLVAASMMCSLCPRSALALDPRKSLSQYSRTEWGQQHGLPQDTIRAIAQTTDGYLWLGTDEGLARFDGYEFASFNKANGDLPANSITALTAAADGSLWIGTSSGLTQYRDKHFRTYTIRQGLPDNAITGISASKSGALWIVAGSYLSRLENDHFTNYAPGPDLNLTSVRIVREDREHTLWVGGFSAVGKMADGKFTPVIDNATLAGNNVNSLLTDRQGNLWIGGGQGLIERSPAGAIRKYTEADGLPDTFVRTIWEDRDGNIWAGTNAGLARLDGSRFVSQGISRDSVRCLFEDREGDLWVGASNGLIRLRDDVFTVYGKPEGWPSDELDSVFQDRKGRVWVGLQEGGLMLFDGGRLRQFSVRDGMPETQVFSMHETRSGELLMGTRAGLVRMQGERFSLFTPPDPLARRGVFGALEDSAGRIWLAMPQGLAELHGKDVQVVVPGGPLLIDVIVTLCLGRDGALWAGSYGKGLWRVTGTERRQFTTADGLSSDQIRALYEDDDGTLWIGTYGGGLNAFRDGHFVHFTEKDGLLSDNIASMVDDGESLWLSTPHGISRISKQQLREFTESRRTTLEPVNYGVEDGLRSAQCAPGYPVGVGGTRTSDGRLWFTTSRGLAVFDPRARKQTSLPPAVELVEMTAENRPVDLAKPVQLAPGSGRVQLRYTAIHLSAPELVQYSYKLNGVDQDWVHAGGRRLINYNSLPHGHYWFTVKAQAPGAAATQQTYTFEVLPWFYETAWFRALCVVMLAAAGWMVYQLRLRQIRYRFALVLEERARLAREIHDTLAQGFVGISSQLDAVAMSMPESANPARQYLDMARRMARHSLTEARRSVMDLRAAALEGQSLASALESGTRLWTAGSGVDVNVDVSGSESALPQEVEQHLLRIAQEAVANALKHAGPSKIWIKLNMEARKLYLRIVDNGHGFELGDAFSSRGGHFGLIGMRERAERLGGELRLASHPGEGTEVEVKVPLP
jgi:signal transduction histidine kinase/ligand-binding sensor domain-containing protein